MRTLLRRLEIARDMALHEPPTASWVIDVHERTLAAIRSADHDRIETVMDEHLAELERAWERATDRRLVRPIPDFLRPLAERDRNENGPARERRASRSRRGRAADWAADDAGIPPAAV
jgi:hypothetical protein